MDIKVQKMQNVLWRDLEALQPEDLKHIFNYQDIEDSIYRYGFTKPLFVWENLGICYIIDGHTRKEVLSNIEDVPDELPAVFIEAKSKNEAIEILLNVYNQKENPIDKIVLEAWSRAENFDIEPINLDGINLKEVRTKMKNQYEKEDELNEEIVMENNFPIHIIANESEFEMLEEIKKEYLTNSTIKVFGIILTEFYNQKIKKTDND